MNRLLCSAIVCGATTGCVSVRDADGPIALFNGSDLSGWAISDYAGHGDVEVEDGELRIHMGESLSGVKLVREPPATVNYEVSLEAKKIDGSDFFCGVTFPVKDSHCSLILGGWGGSLTGLSSLDDEDASQNETMDFIRFDPDIWFAIRVQVTDTHIRAWLDEEQIVDVDYSDKKVSIRFDIHESTPFGLTTFQTTSAMRNIQWRNLE
jgi:hypothetical protein